MKNKKSLEAEKYFLAIANTTTDMIHLNDSEGRILYVNQATETILGYPLKELINTPAFDIIHPDDHETINNDMAGLFTSSSDNQLPSRDIRLRKKDGSYVDVEVRGFVVALDGDKYLGAIIRDISRRKRIEKELENHRNNLEKLVEERTVTLKKALDEIKILKGIFPLCSYCKQILDDKGFWKQLEVYIKEHSDADFSPSICPECALKHFANYIPRKE